MLSFSASQHKNDILIQNGHAMKHEAVIENSSKLEEDTKVYFPWLKFYLGIFFSSNYNKFYMLLGRY